VGLAKEKTDGKPATSGGANQNEFRKKHRSKKLRDGGVKKEPLKALLTIKKNPSHQRPKTGRRQSGRAEREKGNAKGREGDARFFYER